MPEHFSQWLSQLFAIITGLVLTGVFGRLLGSAVARFRRNQPVPEVPNLPRPAVWSVLGWLGFLLLNRVVGSETEQTGLRLLAIQISCGLNVLIAACLPLLLTDGGRRRLDEVGLSATGIGRQVWLGICAFAAAIWPTGVLLVISQFWRSTETEHVFLNALRNASQWEIRTWIAISAVIAAPLAEELLFRVTLQGWLSERLPGVAAIGLTAMLFALIHGWRDALPLVPLALILGYVFHRTRSYWACVVTHALFNATNLMLAVWTS